MLFFSNVGHPRRARSAYFSDTFFHKNSIPRRDTLPQYSSAQDLLLFDEVTAPLKARFFKTDETPVERASYSTAGRSSHVESEKASQSAAKKDSHQAKRSSHKKSTAEKVSHKAKRNSAPFEKGVIDLLLFDEVIAPLKARFFKTYETPVERASYFTAGRSSHVESEKASQSAAKKDSHQAKRSSHKKSTAEKVSHKAKRNSAPFEKGVTDKSHSEKTSNSRSMREKSDPIYEYMIPYSEGKYCTMTASKAVVKLYFTIYLYLLRLLLELLQLAQRLRWKYTTQYMFSFALVRFCVLTKTLTFFLNN